MEYKLVETQKELDFYLEEIKKCKYIAVDTEFIRNTTYYPKLSLIQICFKPNFAIVIDCLSAINLKELIEVIYNTEIVKVFHSSRQDLEIFYHIKKSLPKNIFDTQLAVLLINFAKDISYEKMVKALLNVNLDKTLKNSNWLKRPLSKEHIKYAAFDVLYLYEVYPIILKLLEKHNRIHWLKDLFLSLEDSKIYENRLNKDISKLAKDPFIKDLSLAYNLLCWREEKAKELDVPRNKVIDLDLIKEISKNIPTNEEDLKKIVTNNINPIYIENIFKIISNEKKLTLNIEQKESLNKSQSEIYSILKILLAHISSINKINESIVASNEDLIDIIINKEKSQTKILKGWRFEVFGEPILNFLNEKTFLKIKDNTINLE